MAYTVLPASWILAGKPTKEEIFQQIKTNQESFNTDIELLKQTARIDLFDFNLTGELQYYNVSTINSRMPVLRSPVTGSIVGVTFTRLTSNTTGTAKLEFIIEKSSDDGVNWSPITLDIELQLGVAGTKNGTVNFVSGSAQDFLENDMLRIQVVGVNDIHEPIHISIYGELA